METAMEQRNSLSSSYGQDTSGFGPETDVDTPDEPIGLGKPIVPADEGEVNESGEDSEDGGGWNYYTNGNDQRYSENDHNNEVDDMDRKLNPDAPEFVPVSSPPTQLDNNLQRFLDTANDDFISSSPQKFRETIDNVDLPDENDFACDVKAADLSKLNNAYETKGEFDLINGVTPLGDELNDDHLEHENIKRDVATELFGSNMIENNQGDFVNSNGDDFDDFRRIPDDQQNDGPLDLNRARNLFDGVVDNIDPYTSLMETVPKQDDYNPFVTEKVEEELNTSFSENNPNFVESNVNGNECDNAIEHKDESVDRFGKNEVNGTDDSVVQQEDEENVTSTNTFDSQIPDDSISTANATLGSIAPQLDENDVQTNTNLYDGDSTINAVGYEDRKLDDSVSTTEAMMGSEPNTPMRMVNQSTFESDDSGDEGVDQAAVESWKDSTVNENKENYDPYCMDQTAIEDPEGIIPQVTTKIMPAEEEIQQVVEEETELLQTNEKLPVEEPMCLKAMAKVENSFYEQQDLPESDFTSSTHEALMNAAEPHMAMDKPEEDLLIQNSNIQEQEGEDSDVDEVKCHAEGLKNFQCENEPDHDQANGFELEKNDIMHKEYEDIQHHNDFETTQIQSDNLNEQHYHNDFESNQKHSDDFDLKDHGASEPAQNQNDNLIEQKHHDNFEKNEVDQSHLNHTLVDNHKVEQQFGQSEEVVQDHNHREVESDEEMHSSMIIHSDVESNPPQPYCSEATLAADTDMMSRSMTFEENFQNRSMSDSLYVMETSSDYFGDLQKSTHQEKSMEVPEMSEEQVVSSVTKESEVIDLESKPEIVNESLKSEEIQPEVVQESSESVPEQKADDQKESSNVADVAIAAAAGAAVAAVTASAVALATKKSTTVKKTDSSADKAKTTTTKAAPKPLASKSSATAPLKKTITAAKPKTATSTLSSSRPISAPSRTSTTSKTNTTLKSTTATTTTKTATKPIVSKTSVTMSRPTSAAPKTPTTPRTSTTLKTSTISKTPTSPRTSTTAASKTTPTLKPTTTPRTSLASKQTLTNGTAKPLSRPSSAPLKKPLTNGTTKLTNGTSKLTNGDASKSASSKGPVNLATRTSLAPPKLPPKAKTAPKPTVAPPTIPGPIRRPTASAPKKTETATS